MGIRGEESKGKDAQKPNLSEGRQVWLEITGAQPWLCANTNNVGNLRVASFEAMKHVVCGDHTALTTTDFSVTNQRTSAWTMVRPVIWNSIPESVRSVDNVHTFKRLLKTHFFNQLNWFYVTSFSCYLNCFMLHCIARPVRLAYAGH